MGTNVDVVGRYLIHVLASVLRDEKAKEKPEGITFEELFRLAKFHSVAGMACYGVERLAVKPKEKLWEEWRKYRDLQAAKSFAQLSERQRILEYLAGLHREMVPERSGAYDYYQNIWLKAVEDVETQGVYHLSWDDYYIFMIVHFAKHYFAGGSGIRSIMDIHVFLQKYGTQLHPDYVTQELTKLNLLKFARDAGKLSRIWFEGAAERECAAEAVRGPEAESAGAVRMARYILTSGTYGTREQKAENEIRSIEEKGHSAGMSKLIYFVQRCFLCREGMYFDYPILKKHPALLPLCWVHRWIRSIVKKRDRIVVELRALMK